MKIKRRSNQLNRSDYLLIILGTIAMAILAPCFFLFIYWFQQYWFGTPSMLYIAPGPFSDDEAPFILAIFLVISICLYYRGRITRQKFGIILSVLTILSWGSILVIALYDYTVFDQNTIYHKSIISHPDGKEYRYNEISEVRVYNTEPIFLNKHPKKNVLRYEVVMNDNTKIKCITKQLNMLQRPFIKVDVDDVKLVENRIASNVPRYVSRQFLNQALTREQFSEGYFDGFIITD